MTVVTIIAIAVIGGILALMWPSISNTITSSWGKAGDVTGDCTGANANNPACK